MKLKLRVLKLETECNSPRTQRKSVIEIRNQKSRNSISFSKLRTEFEGVFRNRAAGFRIEVESRIRSLDLKMRGFTDHPKLTGSISGCGGYFRVLFDFGRWWLKLSSDSFTADCVKMGLRASDLEIRNREIEGWVPGLRSQDGVDASAGWTARYRHIARARNAGICAMSSRTGSATPRTMQPSGWRG